MKNILLGLLCVGGFVALTGQTWPFVGNPSNFVVVTATPQNTMNPFAVIQAQQACAGATCNPIDMGQTPDANFVAMVDWNQEPAPTNTGNYCGTTVAPNCVVYKYIDHIRNGCLTPQTQQVLNDAGLPATFAPGTTPPQGAELWFTHQYPTNPTPTPTSTPFRGVAIAHGVNCAAYYAAPTPTPVGGIAISSHPFQMNPDNADFQNELKNVIWPSTAPNYYPQTQNGTSAPMNVYEDTSGILGLGISGGAGANQPFSTEYGCGFNAGKTCRNDLVGTGPYHVADDYDTALGKWANSACPGSPCLKITLNGTSPEAGTLVACNIFNGPAGHCHDLNQTGDVDNTFETVYNKVLVANTAGNIKDFDNESPIYDHLGGGWGSPVLLTTILNTWINFQLDAATTGVTISDLEPGWGSQGTGTIGDLSTDVRLMSIAMEWLAPDYSGTKSSNDRIIPRRLPIGLSNTESPSFFELFLVPFAPYQSEPIYHYNGSIVTVGNGCPSANGDSGGALSIQVACATDNGAIERLEYNQLWFNGHNYGPMAVLVNTSKTDTITIQSSWFQLQPESSYHFAISLAQGEMTSVAQGNIGGGVANFTTCTNVTYCLGSNNTMANNTTSTIPTTIGPHSAVILVTTNS